ncbi:MULTISPECIES: MBL fold metallo-hydrolase [Zhongshania]|uniref:Phosphoribosyl 1,2-cyclic phosphodiesterase n=2 Tax=Zhongshania TaxID=1434050 RepID=A0A840R0H5_9GAMM|nr:MULTISPECIES: MBL fold metallo-hydrolase [Zhongshania]EIF43763.1 metallo-beta-lactamase superfamily domain-containing protein [gamma proteobacterium BDW918]MBB5186056.1 phosphoribosyl 1,2-cyclic phosphodiesterase [Zhongshania antarctica]
MRFASLGSGSKGNATLLETEQSCILIDCGFSIKETERRMARLGRAPSDLTAILVTHEHSDHIKGVLPLARKYKVPVYCSYGTGEHGQLRLSHHWRHLELGAAIDIGGISVMPVAVPHDAREPCQFVFSYRKKTFGLLTDLGSITPVVREHYQRCDALLLECNHDVTMLANGPYPYSLKQRVGGDWGHLNNQQAASLLEDAEVARLQHVVIAHLSEKNNTPALARMAIEPMLVNSDALLSADQEAGFDWLDIA